MADPNLGYTYKAQLSQNIPNPFYNYLTPDVFPGSLRNQATVTSGSLLRPYPQYGGDLTVNNVGDWRSRYQALQLRVQRSYAAGASVLFAYNYNQERNEAYFNDPQQYVEPGRSGWVRTTRGTAPTLAGTYDFPVGKGSKFGSSMHPVLNAAHRRMADERHLHLPLGRVPALPAGGYRSATRHIDNPGRRSGSTRTPSRCRPPFTPRLNPYQFDGITGPIFWNADGRSPRRSRSRNGTSSSSASRPTT